MKKFILMTSGVLVLSSCATIEPPVSRSVRSPTAVSVVTPEIVSPKIFSSTRQDPLIPEFVKPQKLDTLRAQAIAVLLRLGEDITPGPALDALLARVDEQATYIKTKRAGWFQRSLDRGSKYVPMIVQEFAQADIPADLAYLALIESGYSLKLTSSAGARGMWQFMPQTAREYGMKVDNSTDQRLDPVRATRAARAYLLDRAAIYGADSFLFVVASYNAGEGRVNRALRKLDDPIKARTFASIDAKLPKETRDYVPRFIAAAAMASMPEQHGFKSPIFLGTKVVLVASPTRLDTLSQVLGVNAKSLRNLNQELASNLKTTPVVNYMLRVPEAKASKLVAWLNESSNKPQVIAKKQETEKKINRPVGKPDIPKVATVSASQRKLAAPKPAIPKGKYVRYKVQRGNSLSSIAQWFKTSTEQLFLWNPTLGGKHSIRIGQIVEIYGLPRSQKKSNHKVKRHETLGDIAHQYGVSTALLRSWNGVRGDKLRRGQSLVIYHQSQKLAPTLSRTLVYTVKMGNHLSGVAKLFGVNVADIQRWNKLHSKRIYNGQKLRIEQADGYKVVSHKVERGDSLGALAGKFGVSKDLLAFSNGLKSTAWLKIGRHLQIVAKDA